jgi:hypothetical protein
VGEGNDCKVGIWPVSMSIKADKAASPISYHKTFYWSPVRLTSQMVSSLTLSALVFALALAAPLTWAQPLSDNFDEEGKRFHSIKSIKYGTRD